MNRAKATALASLALAACGGGGSSTVECKANLLPGDLVITEIMADYDAPAGSSGADTGKEWFEIYNASSHPIDLTGVVLTHSRPDGSSVKSHTITNGSIAPSGYLVLGDVDPSLLPAWVGYGYGAELGEMFNTNGGKLAISCGATEVDHALYAKVTAGHSQQFDGNTAPDYTANDDLARWCVADPAESTAYDPPNVGTPGTANQGCQVISSGQCNDNGTMRDTVTPAPGELVITEIMTGPSKVADAAGEWFEVQALADVDLNGLGLDRAGDSADPNLVAGADCIHLTAGQFAVFAKNADTTMNGGLPPVAGTFTFSLVGGTATSPGDIQLLVGTTVIDAVTWTKSPTGKSRSLDPDFASADNNDADTPWCDGIPPYGLGDLGTPGAANGQCTILPPAGMCMDGATLRPIVKPGVGDLVISEIMPNPSGDDTKQEWFEAIAKKDLDLNELGLDRAGDSTNPNVINSVDCLHLAANDYALFARSADTTVNGGLPVVDATFTFSMVTGSAASPGDVRIMDGTTVIDAYAWMGSPAKAAKQLDPDKLDAVLNDTDDAATWCTATTPYAAGTDKGTPGAPNDVQCQ
ncbi:MAG: lamin tail domain-containing protein [Deltaproteobacteria bacterium]|nr:lamin tail domain-containing protein [Deltaproteobacteria bacterium]